MTSTRPLGRRPSETDEHILKYPLTATTAPAAPTPMVIGVNWYSNFDAPVAKREGKTTTYWIGLDSRSLGRVRGGHCVALKHRGASDPATWWDFYDQGAEGACVGFGSSRMMSLVNRKRYFARWLWDQAKLIDEWADTNPGDDNGTSVRAALEVLRSRGHVAYDARKHALLNVEQLVPDQLAARDALPPRDAEGISAYRWATSTADALEVLGYSDVGYVDVLNSWGRDYPHLVRMPAETLERLRREDGEVGVVTDR
jgi:hypothetical protein